MPANRFMVIKFKELLKTVIFAILGVIIIVALIHFVAGKFSNATALYNPGEYSSEIALENGSISVKVTVDRKKIVAVDIVDQSEVVPVFYPLFATIGEQVADQVVSEQTAEIEFSGGNDVTANLILDAIEEGLAQAGK